MYPTTTKIILYNRIRNYLNATSNFDLSLFTRVKKVHPTTPSNPPSIRPSKKSKIEVVEITNDDHTQVTASNVCSNHKQLQQQDQTTTNTFVGTIPSISPSDVPTRSTVSSSDAPIDISTSFRSTTDNVEISKNAADNSRQKQQSYSNNTIQDNNIINNENNESQPLYCQLCNEDKTTETTIVKNIKNFMNVNDKMGGPNKHTSNIVRTAILSACTYQTTTGIEKIRTCLDINKTTFYKFMATKSLHENEINMDNFILPKKHVYSRSTKSAQLQSINDFCHSDEGSSIDSNSHKVFELEDGSKHPRRIFRVKTIKENYSIFVQSEVVEQFKNINPNYKTPSLSTFKRNLCPCLSTPTMMSCVDINTSGLCYYMKGLGDFFEKEKILENK